MIKWLKNLFVEETPDFQKLLELADKHGYMVMSKSSYKALMAQRAALDKIANAKFNSRNKTAKALRQIAIDEVGEDYAGE